MAPAPWESVPAEDSLFVLVTGTNSGVGLGIGKRLIDEFLVTRSLTSHLVLIATTRSVKKSKETIHELQSHARKAARSPRLQARSSEPYDPLATTRRIHLLTVQIDTCDFISLYQAADLLKTGTLGSLCEDAAFQSLSNVRIPRLDALIFNAGIGGWSSIDILGGIWGILTKGPIYTASWPAFKTADVGATVDPLRRAKKEDGKDSSPRLGEVFCANTFGHYMFARALLPLLRHPRSSGASRPARIIWTGSLDTSDAHFSLDDFQATRSSTPYESSKRILDLLSLSATRPASRAYAKQYLGEDSSSDSKDGTVTPRMYLMQPGVVLSGLFNPNFFLYWATWLLFCLVRLLGSPWHPVTGYRAAVAPVWLALQEQEALDAADAECVKWGSSTSRSLEDRVKKTEVEGWGWEGRVEDMEKLRSEVARGVARKIAGRKPGALDASAESLEKFEAMGAEVWRKMEELRAEWDARTKEAMKGL